MADSGCLGLSALCPVTGAMGIRVPRESRFWKVRFVDVWNRFRPFPSFRIVKILNRFLFLSFVRESPKTKTGLFARIQIPVAEMSLKLASILSVLLLCILSSLSKVAGSCDSLPVYREHIRHSADNASKSFWAGIPPVPGHYTPRTVPRSRPGSSSSVPPEKIFCLKKQGPRSGTRSPASSRAAKKRPACASRFFL